MKKKNPPMESTLAGYVRATDWDLNDVVNEISIEADYDEYIVKDNDMGKELFELLDREVEVTGLIKEDKEGIKWITLTSYKELREAEDIEDDEYGCDDSDWQDFGSEQGESPI